MLFKVLFVGALYIILFRKPFNYSKNWFLIKEKGSIQEIWESHAFDVGEVERQRAFSRFREELY